MKKIFFLIVIFLLVNKANSQSCSDAGFCTLGSLKPSNNESKNYKNKLTLSTSYGIGDSSLSIISPSIIFDHNFNKQWFLQTKITTNSASGKLGNYFGIGDIFLSVIHSPLTEKKWKKNYLLGLKIPLGNGNSDNVLNALPLDYQSTLGTVDVITGATISNNNWMFSVGYQQPLNKSNLKIFGNDLIYERKGDVLLRANYTTEEKNKMKYSFGVLNIYHLANDEFANNTSKIVAKGSDGLTLNITAGLMYKASEKIDININAGMPLVARENRTDGLTRKFAVGIDLVYKMK